MIKQKTFYFTNGQEFYKGFYRARALKKCGFVRFKMWTDYKDDVLKNYDKNGFFINTVQFFHSVENHVKYFLKINELHLCTKKEAQND